MGLCVIVALAASVGYVKLQTPTYQSTALVQESSTTPGSQSATAPLVSLPDPVQELGSTTVQQRAAKILGGTSVAAVAAEVTGTVNQTTGALAITATDHDPERARVVANAYAQAFVDQTQAIVQTQLNKITVAMASVGQQITALQDQSASAVNTAKLQGLTSSLGALQNQQTEIQFGEPYASVQVAAELPTSPVGLGTAKVAAIGLAAGLLVGCGAALGQEQLDTRLRTTPDIEAVTDLPILAELPLDPEVRSGATSVALVQAPHSQMAEAVRELRTSLRVLLDDVPCPLITVTSPEAGDGKTFVTANLAAAWAMSGSTVIVVSADFRRPRLEESLGLQMEGLPGLADVILANWKESDGAARTGSSARHDSGRTGPGGVERRTPGHHRPATPRDRRVQKSDNERTTVSSVLLDSGIYGMSVLPAGTRLEHPSELFGSPGMQPVMEQLPLIADVVLFDTPPVLAVPDTAILGGVTSGAVVVASEGRTDRTDLERTIHRLESTHCHVLGVVMNGARRSFSDSYQYYARFR